MFPAFHRAARPPALVLVLMLAIGLPAASRPTSGTTVIGLNADPMVELHRLNVVDLATGKATPLGGLFDFDDEIGSVCDPVTGVLWSVTNKGAGSNLLPQLLQRFDLTTGHQAGPSVALNHSKQDDAWGVNALSMVGGELFCTIFEGDMGWIHGVFRIDTATGDMSQVASIEMDAILWTNAAIDPGNATMYLQYSTDDGTANGQGWLLAVDLHARAPPVKLKLAKTTPELSQPVVFQGALYGWVGGPGTGQQRLFKLEIGTGDTADTGVTLPGYMAAESVRAAAGQPAGTYLTSGSLDGAKKGAYIATFSVSDTRIVSTVDVVQPYWFLCPNPAS